MRSKTLRAQKEKTRAGTPKMAEVAGASGTANLQSISAEMIVQISKNVTAAIDDRLIKMQVTIEDIKAGLESHARRLDTAEQRIAAQEDAAVQMERQIAELQTKAANLLDRAEDQENRQRRNNVRLIGIPESVADTDLLALVESWLPEQLGLQGEERALKCERVHRMGQRLEANGRPRPVIARIINWNHKVALLRAYRKATPLLYNGSKILMFQDYSTSVAAKRREMAPFCTELINKGITCALLFPAKIRVQRNGAIAFLQTKQAAQAYIAQLTEQGT